MVFSRLRSTFSPSAEMRAGRVHHGFRHSHRQRHVHAVRRVAHRRVAHFAGVSLPAGLVGGAEFERLAEIVAERGGA